MNFFQVLHYISHPWLLLSYIIISLLFVFISFGLTYEWYVYSIKYETALNILAVYFCLSLSVLGGAAYLLISLYHA